MRLRRSSIGPTTNDDDERRIIPSRVQIKSNWNKLESNQSIYTLHTENSHLNREREAGKREGRRELQGGNTKIKGNEVRRTRKTTTSSEDNAIVADRLLKQVNAGTTQYGNTVHWLTTFIITTNINRIIKLCQLNRTSGSRGRPRIHCHLPLPFRVSPWVRSGQRTLQPRRI